MNGMELTGNVVADGVIVVALLGLMLLLMTVEAAVMHTSAARVERREGARTGRVTRVAELLAQPEDLLNPLRLVIVIVQLSEATLVTVMALRWLAPAGVAAAVALNMAVVFLLAEVVARTLGILYAERVALVLVRPVSAVVRLWPIRWLVSGLITAANVIVPGKGLRRGPFVTPEELIALADAAVQNDVLEQAERDLIESVIEFSDTVVREVMIHRTDMVSVEKTFTVATTLELASELGFSRLPVLGENIDDVVGLIYVKDLIRAELDGHSTDTIESLLRPATIVPETKKVDELLREMQRDSFHMAIAVDEYGGVAGLVTMEDLIEELVGEIVDEYDREEPLLQRLRDGSLRVDARILIDEVNHLGGLDLPEGHWDTVGGLVFDSLGRVPVEGEVCEQDGHTLRVDRMQGRRIMKVSIFPRSQDASEVAIMAGDRDTTR